MNGNAAQKLGGEPLNPYAAPAGEPPLIVAKGLGGELATLSSRLWARMIDQFLLLLALAPAAVAGALLAAREDDSNPSILLLTLAAGGLGAIGFYVYQCHLIASTGQSLGKRFSHVRIVLDQGEPPGFVRGVLFRSWVFLLLSLIPGVGSLIGLTDTLMIFGSERRCLHDRLAGTRVLND
ncbi:MAG: hypothetical protein RL685_1716 [Pseudomonadota bacterium]|jgi:uncharacterized RDD family membrane protein YckC